MEPLALVNQEAGGTLLPAFIDIDVRRLPKVADLQGATHGR